MLHHVKVAIYPNVYGRRPKKLHWTYGSENVSDHIVNDINKTLIDRVLLITILAFYRVTIRKEKSAILIQSRGWKKRNAEFFEEIKSFFSRSILNERRAKSPKWSVSSRENQPSRVWRICHGTASLIQYRCIHESRRTGSQHAYAHVAGAVYVHTCTRVQMQITNERRLEAVRQSTATGYTSRAISNRLNPSWLYAWELGNTPPRQQDDFNRERDSRSARMKYR